MSLFQNVGRAVTAMKLWKRLREETMKGKLLTAALGLGGAILTAIVAKFTSECPSLFSNVGAIVTAGLGGTWAYLQTKKDWKESGILGLGAAGVAAAAVQIKMMCGPDFFTVAPTIATAGLWVGIMAYLKSPKAA